MNGRIAAPAIAVAAAALAAAFACTSGASCPAGAVQIASYTVTYTALDGGDTCIVYMLPDGGATYQDLLTTPSPSSMLLCASGIDSGTPQLYLSSAALTGAGTTTYTSSSTESDVSNTACICDLSIGDSLSITLNTIDGGPFAFLPPSAPDAGVSFTPVPTFTGQLNYSLQAAGDNTVACGCNVPCGAHYSLSATQ